MYIEFRDIILFLFLICFVVLTIFLSIALYRLILTLKSVHQVIEENRESVNSSLKSVSGICTNVDGVSGKISSKIEEDEFDSYIPTFMPYITGGISFILSLINVFKANKQDKEK